MYTRPATRDRDFDRLLRTSYGLPPNRPPARRGGRSVTMSTDTGTEVLPQPGVLPAPPEEPTEYVVDREPVDLPQPAEPAEPGPAPVPTPAPLPGPAAPPLDAPAAPAAQAAPAPATPPPPATVPAPAGVPVPPAPATAAAPDPAPASGEPVSLPASLASSPLTTDDLAADLRNILSGSAPPDPGPPVEQPPVADPGRPLPESKNEQAIFDKIAQSMQYANSFDLGSVDLRNRFNQFDRQADARRAPARTAPRVSAPSEAAPAADQTEMFWRSLPPGALSGVPLVDGCRTGVAALSVPEHSVPMYDTGEHVQAGGDLYPDQLPVNGVLFSYGQVMAMGDLYDDVSDLRSAQPAELNALKALIVEDTNHYTGRGGNGVSNQRWNDATDKRYLALADVNYAHFSPPSVLKMTDATSQPDNRQAWERYHEQAIAEMRSIVAANPNSSPAPFGPLTTNAFGDHFLTDAFAAGHLVNKEVVMERVRSAFYSGGTTLSSAGTAFLGRLAAACWARKPVRDVFSPLEQFEGSLLGLKHFNFDTENMFRRLLVGIAEQAPSKVLNLPLKALHDHLNEVGVEVANDAGDEPWPLKGDGHLAGTRTLPIMKRAVQQSVDNILSPEILVSEAPRGPLSLSTHPALLARVWKHVPQPTAAGRAQALAALATYTDLGSTVLLNKAAEVIEKQAPFIAGELIDNRIVRHEDGADFEWNGSAWARRRSAS